MISAPGRPLLSDSPLARLVQPGDRASGGLVPLALSRARDPDPRCMVACWSSLSARRLLSFEERSYVCCRGRKLASVV